MFAIVPCGSQSRHACLWYHRLRDIAAAPVPVFLRSGKQPVPAWDPSVTSVQLIRYIIIHKDGSSRPRAWCMVHRVWNDAVLRLWLRSAALPRRISMLWIAAWMPAPRFCSTMISRLWASVFFMVSAIGWEWPAGEIGASSTDESFRQAREDPSSGSKRRSLR